MPKYIKPFQIQGPKAVRPMNENEFGNSNASAGEKVLFDSVAQEQIKIAGTPLDFFSFDLKNSDHNPLYGETTDKRWIGPYKFKAVFSWANPSPQQREEGYRDTFNSECWIARMDFESSKCKYPDRGDIIRVWNIPYINDVVNGGDGEPNGGYFFNVTNVADDSHMLDNPEFATFKLTLTRYSEFDPERKIYQIGS